MDEKVLAQINAITNDEEILECMAEIDKLPLLERAEPMETLRKATIRVQIAKLDAAMKRAGS